MMTLGKAAMEPPTKSSKGKMRLESFNVERAVNGPLIVRCNYFDGSQYDTKTKVFEDADEMAKFVAKAFGKEQDEED